ncbi:hypothetical protein T484DRAFT_1767144 [Baffinella frigidus]|nr:hypothetical protein T484DRAFT_1767144 [Cryptophyta sp. CCMP2293]
MEELDTLVDRFIIIEGDLTFRGHPKQPHLASRLTSGDMLSARGAAGGGGRFHERIL